MRQLLILLCTALLTLSACSSQPTPPPLKIGNEVDFTLLQDQHANPFPHADTMTLMLFADSMAANRDAREALEQVDPSCFRQGKLVYIANVSGMPSLITKMIAVPKMRNYSFPVWLDFEGDATASLPVQEDSISLVQISDGAITSIDYVQGVDAVLNGIIPLCGRKAQQLAGR